MEKLRRSQAISIHASWFSSLTSTVFQVSDDMGMDDKNKLYDELDEQFQQQKQQVLKDSKHKYRL